MTTINIPCPTCNTVVPLDKHPGLVINRKNFLRSRLISLREEAQTLKDRKPKPGLESAVEIQAHKDRVQTTIQEMESELRILEGL